MTCRVLIDPRRKAAARIAGRVCGKLTYAEEHLLDHIFLEKELVLSATSLFNGKNYPPSVACDDHIRIRAEFLRSLIIHRETCRHVPAFGIRIMGAWVENPLDLSSAVIDFPLVFSGCYIPDEMDLRDANTALISLKGSHTGSIRASRLVVNSSLALNDGFWSKGPVRLHGATIRGVFDARNARFEQSEVPSKYVKDIQHADAVLMAEDAIFQSDVYLSGVRAVGCVTFAGAKIVDSLELVRTKRISVFKSDSASALNLDRVDIGGDVLMGNSEDHKASDTEQKRQFQAKGVVSLVHARVGGSLRCGSTWLDHEGQITLDARDIHVDGSLFFEDGFSTNGLIRFTSGEIGACLYFNGATFSGRYRTGLIAKRTSVNGTLAWTALNIESALLQLDLRDAAVGQFEDDDKSWPRHGNLLLDGFVYERILTRIPITEGRLTRIKRTASNLWHCVRSAPLLGAPLTRLTWLQRQLSPRFTTAHIGDPQQLANTIVHGHGPIAAHCRALLLKDDVLRIESNLTHRHEVSELDKNQLLIALNLHLNADATSGGAAASGESLTRIRKMAREHAKTMIAQFPGALKAMPPAFGYFKPQPHEQLASFLLDEGDKTESVRTLIAKEDIRRKYSGEGLLWQSWRSLLKVTTAYGYKPYWTGWYAAFFIFVGALIFGAARSNFYMVPAREYLYAQTQDTGTHRIPPEYPEFNELTYSADVFLPIIDLHQQSYWIPSDKESEWHYFDKHGKKEPDRTPPRWYDPIVNEIASRNWSPIVFHGWLWFEIAAGWLLSTLFFAGLFRFLHTSELHEEHKHK